jgi:hypothetical protein
MIDAATKSNWSKRKRTGRKAERRSARGGAMLAAEAQWLRNLGVLKAAA